MEDGLLVLDRVECVGADAVGELTTTERDYQPQVELSEAAAGLAALRTTASGSASESSVPGRQDDTAICQIIEALLFAADAPLSAARLADLIQGGSATRIRLCIAELNDSYAATGRSFRIEEIAGGYRMMTLPRFEPWLARLNQQRAATRLSPAALETLAIVAYKQPIILSLIHI